MSAETGGNSGAHYFLFLRFLAVLADFLKSLAVGAPFEPGLRIFSPDPAAMRFRFAWMFAYSPRFLGMDLVTYTSVYFFLVPLPLGFFLVPWP